jgi:hypothetical protein
MWNSGALSIPGPESLPGQSYTLTNDIPGMQLVAVGDGTRLGPILRIPKGADIDAFGEGFNERTQKIRYEGCFYFVFEADLKQST